MPDLNWKVSLPSTNDLHIAGPELVRAFLEEIKRLCFMLLDSEQGLDRVLEPAQRWGS